MVTVKWPKPVPPPPRPAKRAQPPAHLESVEQDLFRQLVAQFTIDDARSVSLLQVAMEAHQRMRKARQTIDAEGTTYFDRFKQPRMHPAVIIERDSRDSYLRAMRQLNLAPPNSPVGEGRSTW
jgi:P27 family predicted phage terminase small subunit